jgi:tetratricopeptide (TPR) repeat protein
MRAMALGFVLLWVGVPARAEWLEAGSDHFVIYSDQKEQSVREFADRLERFDAAMALLYRKPKTQPSPSNRVTIFVVDDASEVREVAGGNNRFLTGFYVPRAGGSIAVIPKLKSASRSKLSGEKVLYHEYAHHFMLASLTTQAYPRWFVEGFAEFFGGAQFKADGSLELGVPPYYRAMELAYAREVPIRNLLDYAGGVSDAQIGYTSFYGQSWAVFHYLQMSTGRAGQISSYGRELAGGRSALEAAAAAFGDLDQLEKDVESYLNQRKVSVLSIKQSSLGIGPVTLRKLRPGEADMMPIIIESKVGVSDEEAKRLIPEARKIAARHPDDPTVLAALAEAEFDAGNDDAAIAAADRALALDPNQINAHLQRGYALERKVVNGALPKETWKEVRAQYVKANKVENDHPVPLVRFYLTYAKQGEKPTKNAIDGLEWALTLAPFDASLRWLVAGQLVTDERFSDAVPVLRPLAYSPHPGEHTEIARRLLKEVEERLKEKDSSSTPASSP